MRFYHLCLAAVNFLSCLFFSQIPDFFTYPALFTYSIFSLRSFHRPLVRSGRHILTSSIRKKHYRLHRRCKPDMAAHGIKMDLEQMTGLIPSTFQVVMILGIMAIISFWLIDRLYKQRGE